MERSHELEEMDRKPFEALMLDYDHKAEVGEYVHNRLTAQQIEHIRRIESWSQRKKDLFKREHIQAAYQHLDTWMNRANKTLEPMN